MLRICSLIPLALVFGALSVHAQSESDDWRLLFVNGSADTLVRPDQVVFFLNVEVSHLSLDSVRIKHDKKMEKLMELTKKMKIDRNDVRTDLLDIQPNDLIGGVEGTDFNPRAFKSDEDQEQMREYYADINVVITLRDLSKYAEFLSGILALDIDLAREPQYQLSSDKEIHQALMLRAIRDARRQADVLAAETGMTVGNPIRIDEPDWYSDLDYRYAALAGRYGSPYGGGDAGLTGMSSPTTPDLLSFSVSVSITYQIEPK